MCIFLRSDIDPFNTKTVKRFMISNLKNVRTVFYDTTFNYHSDTSNIYNNNIFPRNEKMYNKGMHYKIMNDLLLLFRFIFDFCIYIYFFVLKIFPDIV